MPIREFECTKCNKKDNQESYTWEELRLPSEDQIQLKCPKCKDDKWVRQLMSSSNFKFKQGGFSASSVDISAGNHDTDLGNTEKLI